MYRGKIRKYIKECQWRKRLSRLRLTLRNESIGSKQDLIPW